LKRFLQLDQTSEKHSLLLEKRYDLPSVGFSNAIILHDNGLGPLEFWVRVLRPYAPEASL